MKEKKPPPPKKKYIYNNHAYRKREGVENIDCHR